MYAVGNVMPAQQVAGLDIMKKLLALERNMEATKARWGVITSGEIEFIVPDRLGTYLWVPLSPHCCLMVNPNVSGEISRADAIVLNNFAMRQSVRYIFARDLSGTGVEWSRY